MQTQPQTAVPAAPSPALVRRATIGASIGSVVEWFDVALYGYLAVIIGEVFFHSEDPTSALLSSFAVFASAFIVRPLGGLFFGALGDRIGRKNTLAAVILTASLATFGIGLLPGFDTIGVAAPVLLVVLRLVQGFSAGGEMGGASAFVAEYAPKERRGYYVSFVEMGCIMGFLLGAATVLAMNLVFTEGQMHAWGWRIPFLVAAPLGIVGLYIRSRLEETPEFVALQNAGQVKKNPLKETVVHHWRAVLIVGAFALFQNVAIYIVLTYVPTHLTVSAGFSSLTGSLSAVITMAVLCAMIPVTGWLSDRVGRRPVLLSACVSSLILAVPMFLAMEIGNPTIAVLAHVVLGLSLSFFLGPVLAAANELFTTDVRYGGFSLGYNLSVSLFGGTAPFVVTLMIAQTGFTASPGVYIGIAAIVTGLVVFSVKESAPRIVAQQQ
ncbi:glycine betaine/L-proline transporter ProP [Brevibacterium daeguense]|uniref:Glycine betaine/L-proline transporter ProP n=1 Tax=Brevibacterium daeguense TaxID=909936 RepID=A0ABP8EHH3_9MICO|nr:MFS transporter [Brevibacterium daeguense]